MNLIKIIVAIAVFTASNCFGKETSTTPKTSNKLSLEKNKSNDHVEIHYAKAYLDSEQKNLLYTEEHKAFYKSGKLLSSINSYYSINEKKIAELNSDYSNSLTMPTYIFKDLRNDYQEGLRFFNDEYIIFKQDKEKKEQTNILSERSKVFSCQGWHYYLISNLEGIKDSTLEMKLIFPSKLDYYSFRIRTLESTEKQIKLRLEFDSWFMRLFAPHLDLTYDQVNKKITKYYGPSNILDESGNIQNVHIFYE